MCCRFQVVSRVCAECKSRHAIAVACTPCGRLDYGKSPETLRCYSCQFRGKDGMTLAALKARYRAIWRMAGNTPYPPALA